MGDIDESTMPGPAWERSPRLESYEARSDRPVRLLSPSPRKRKRRRRFADWHDHWSRKPLSTLTLGALLVLSPQLLGGSLPWAIDVITALSMLTLVVVALRSPALERRLPRFAVIMLIMLGWTALQATPLPCGFVKLLAPDSVAKRQAVEALFGVTPSATCVLSQDPGNTREEILKLVSLTATFISAWAFAASGGWRGLFFLVGLSSFAISAVALAHGALELHSVFGVYHPVGLDDVWLLSPLMNSNNLGSFAALGAPLWIGLTFRESDKRLRAFGYVAIATTSVVAMLSLSRGAIGQLLAGYAVMGWVILRRKPRNTRDAEPTRAATPLTGRLGLVIAGVLGLGVGVFLVGSEAVHQFKAGGLDKLDLIGAALRFAGQHGLVGVGRGAFSSAFISSEGSVSRYQYAENFIAHWAAEWGIPLTLLLLAAIGFELLTAAKPKGSLARSGALTALCLLGAQNLVDFGFEQLGIATVAVALFAGCIAPALDEERTAARANALQPPVLITVATLCAGVASLAWLGPRIVHEALPVLTREMRQSLASSERATFRRQALHALELHPSEPTLTLLVGSEALAQHDPKTLAWLNRSMHLAPKWARPHQLAFRWLWITGQGRQALLELKLAAAIDLDIVLEDACRLGRVDADWALAVAPDNALRRAYMERVGLCIGDSKSSEEFDRAVLKEYPTALFPLMQEAARLRAAEEYDEALGLLERAQAAHRDDHRPTVQRFWTLLAAGRLRELLVDIDAAAQAIDLKHRADLLEVKAYALAKAGSPELAIQCVEEIRRLAGTDPQLLAQSYRLQGQVHLALKSPGQALAAYREAYRINEDTNSLVQVANIAESVGDRAQALWAYVKLCEREPRGGGCERRNALLPAPKDNSAP